MYELNNNFRKLLKREQLFFKKPITLLKLSDKIPKDHNFRLSRNFV